MRLLLLPALLCLLAATDPPVQVSHPWARASAGNARNGAVFLTVTGAGTADKLVAASTPVSETAELHETIDDKGIMKMRPLAALALEPGKAVTLAPGGPHVMLMGLKAPLKQGDTFPLTLRFARAGPVTVTVTVEAIGGGHKH